MNNRVHTLGNLEPRANTRQGDTQFQSFTNSTGTTMSAFRRLVRE